MATNSLSPVEHFDELHLALFNAAGIIDLMACAKLEGAALRDASLAGASRAAMGLLESAQVHAQSLLDCTNGGARHG